MANCTNLYRHLSFTHLAIMIPMVGKMSGLWVTTESRNSLYTESLSTPSARSVLAALAVSSSMVSVLRASSFTLNNFWENKIGK